MTRQTGESMKASVGPACTEQSALLERCVSADRCWASRGVRAHNGSLYGKQRGEEKEIAAFKIIQNVLDGAGSESSCFVPVDAITVPYPYGCGHLSHRPLLSLVCDNSACLALGSTYMCSISLPDFILYKQALFWLRGGHLNGLVGLRCVIHSGGRCCVRRSTYIY